HQQQLEHYNGLGNDNALYYEANTTAANVPSQTKAVCNLDQVVYGWHPYWVGSAYNNYDWNLLSHFSFFSYEVDAATGNANSTHGWSTSAAVDAALASGNTKVTLCVTLFSSHATFFSSSTAQQTLITNLINLVQTRGAHGVQIDFEGLPNSQKTNFANWMVDLSTQMKAAIPGSEISTVLYAVDWNDVFDFTIMEPSVDHYIIMGYAYYYQGSGTAGPCDPLYHFGSTYNYTLSKSITYYLNKGCPNNKLVLGLPYYGYEWATTSTTVPSSTTASGNARTYQVVKNNSSGDYIPGNYQYDQDSYSDIYTYTNTTPEQTFITLENGFRKRLEHIRKSGIAGMGIWALGYDDGYSELWDALNDYMTDCYVDSCSGEIHDFGGPYKDYYDNENYTWTINPPGASSLDISFTQFDLEANFDYLYIYDGPTAGSAQIAGSPFTGTTSPGTFTTSSGAVTFKFTSDGATNNPGFYATYSCNQDVTAPTTTIATPNPWETSDFITSFTDIDDVGGSGISNQFYSISDFNGTEWRSNNSHGYYTDHFDLAVHPEWTNLTGNWNIVSTELIGSDEVSSNTNLYSSLTQSNTNSYLYHWTGQINGSGTNRRAGLHFFCDDATLTNRGNSYFVYWRTDSDKCQIYSVDSDVFNLETDDLVTINPNTTYDFKIYYDPISGEIKAFLDNVLVSSWTDPTPLTTGNSISFRSGNAEMVVDDFNVYKSRTSSAMVSIGSSADEIRFQNQNPSTPSGQVQALSMDTANNLSSIVVEQFNIDWTDPLDALVEDGLGSDIDTFYVNTEISANWSGSSDIHSGVSAYFYSIGTAVGLSDIVGLTPNGTATGFTVTGLSLVYGVDYYVNVYTENGAGLFSNTTSSDGQHLKLSSINPIADFSLSNTILCAGDSIQIINNSTDATSFLWQVSAGATLSNPTASNPWFTATSTGSYTISLIATGSGGIDSSSVSVNIIVIPPPNASGFPDNSTVDLPSALVNFTNTSTNASNYSWGFGDGSTSTDVNPWHTYTAAGNYTVTLVAQNGICANDTIYFSITVNDPVGIKEHDQVIQIYPNPFTGRLYINGIQNASYRFYNLIGKLVAEGTTNGIIQTTSILSSGIYFLEIVEGNQRFRKEVVKF
ncbi:MAG: PKD domain-containing protein, partial [Flavobacteriales bacterium]|nr:PKD domain-containing protein [Flavobacteriales bacterium]